jgi:hypothetical protein
MFQASRQLFHRTSTSTSTPTPTGGTASQSKAEDAKARADRHPAMRGLDVSPVHGHHCICGRCEQDKNAA